MAQDSAIIVVGCGGTGGFVAEGICRLYADYPFNILLIDPDKVELQNLKRQNFYRGDLGEFKSQALANRLARKYGKAISYSVSPFDSELVGHRLGGGMYTRAIQGIIIGCVDNAAAREEISRSLRLGNWWIDSGNGYSSGQVLIGNATSEEALYQGFDWVHKEVKSLPAPSWQLPSLLIPEPRSVRKDMDCADAIVNDTQSPIINQTMAMLVLEIVHRLFKGTLTWMGVYIDMEDGTLQTLPANPETVARISGVKQKLLFANRCGIGERYSMRRP